MPNLNPNSTKYIHNYEPNNNDLTLAMAYDPEGSPVLRIDDTSLQHTSKDRAKVSNYEVVFFNTFQFDKEDDVWSEVVVNGGTSVHSTYTSEVVMTVDGTQPGSKVTRQSRNVMRYIPGRTGEATFAVVFGPNITGIKKRVGVFDENNGFYLEQEDGQLTFVIRSKATGSVLETRIPQAEWNQNSLDGTDNKGRILDVTKRQIVIFEYEWYGSGMCELKFLIDDHPISAHKQFHGNKQTLPWMQTPFNPIRYEIENVSATSGTASLYQGSNSVLLEGQTAKEGIAASIASPITGTTMAAANQWYPVLSIRLRPGRLSGVVLPTFFQVATVDNTNVFYRVVRNAVIGTGGTAWAVVPDSGSTFTEYQTYTTPSAIADANQGSRIDTGFVIAGGGGAAINLNPSTQYQIGRQTTTTIGDTSDTITILCAASNTNKKALAALTWIEQR